MQQFSKVFCYGFPPLSSKLARQGTITRICHYVTPTYDYCNYSILANSSWYLYPSSSHEYYEAIPYSSMRMIYSNSEFVDEDEYVFNAILDDNFSDICEIEGMFGDFWDFGDFGDGGD